MPRFEAPIPRPVNRIANLTWWAASSVVGHLAEASNRTAQHNAGVATVDSVLYKIDNALMIHGSYMSQEKDQQPPTSAVGPKTLEETLAERKFLAQLEAAQEGFQEIRAKPEEHNVLALIQRHEDLIVMAQESVEVPGPSGMADK